MFAYNKTRAWLRQYVPDSEFDTVVQHLARWPSYALGDGCCIAVDESYRAHPDAPLGVSLSQSFLLTVTPYPSERVYGTFPYKFCVGLIDTHPEGPCRGILDGSNFRHAYRAGHQWATDIEGFYQGRLVFHRERVFRKREDAQTDFQLALWCFDTLTKREILALPSGLTEQPTWSVEALVRTLPDLWYVQKG